MSDLATDMSEMMVATTSEAISNPIYNNPTLCPIVTTNELVTPEDALRFLDHNVGNRNPSASREGLYAMTMRRGQWLPTAETIKFAAPIGPCLMHGPDCDLGRMLDGQQRMMALIEYGQPLVFSISRNVPEEAFVVMDSGKVRTPADAFPNDTGVRRKMTALRLLITIANGYDPRNKNDLALATTGDLNAEYHLEREMLDSIDRMVYTLCRHVGGRDSSWLAAAVMAFRINPIWAEEFFGSILSGANLTMKDPRLALRNTLNQIRASGSNKRAVKHSDILMMIILTWNYWLSGVEREQVRAVKVWQQMQHICLIQL